MLGLWLLGVEISNALGRIRGDDIVGTKIEGSEDLKGDPAVEAEAVKSHRRNFVAILVKGLYLEKRNR